MVVSSSLRLYIAGLLLVVILPAFAQDNLSISGSLEANGNFYIRDPRIGAANIPQYDRQLAGADMWLSLRAQVSGFDIGVRYDLFANSALLNPSDSYTNQGLGRWYASKKVGKLGITGGYIYDQIGSGVIFRAYEERPLLIDNALVGLRLAYELSSDWIVKGFAGRQKNLFGLYPSFLKGASIEGFKSFGENGNITIAPGAGILHKTISDDQMDALAGTLSQYTPSDFIPEAPFNAAAFTVYNTLSAGRFTWYAEAAYKTEDVIYDNFATRRLWTGIESQGKFVLTDGYVLYTTLSYAGGGLGISGQYKRTRNFNFRTDPFVSLNRGFVNFLPPGSRVNTYRLTARYSPATQDLDEQVLQADVRYAVNKNLSLLVNVTRITRPEAEEHHDIYSEIFTQFTLKKPRLWTLIGGLQLQQYDQELYEGKPGVPKVETITPYVDFLYRFNPKKSIRTELQYMQTEQDYGSWLYALAEFSLAPHWIFEISDMWNVAPKEKADGSKGIGLHYPTAGVVYSAGPTRYAFRFVKQVEGIVCSGGICRLEPAFSGFKLNVTSNF